MKAFLQRAVLATVMLLATIMARAYDFEVDGICYNKISDTEVEVTSGGDNSYSGDIRIPSTITVSSNTYSVTSIGERAFRGCSSLTSIELPNSLTSIGQEAFDSCSALTSIVIPNSVTSIGSYCFYDCSQLASVVLSNSITSIESGVFKSCGFKSIDIPNSVTTICNNAFSYTSLTSITLPNSVTRIERAAFQESQLTSITIPASVNYLGKQVFRYCFNLTSIDVDKDNKYFCSIDSVLFNKTQKTLIQYPLGKQGATYSIPNCVDTIGETAFANSMVLSSIVIPTSVVMIGRSAFHDCRALTSVEIPNSVELVDEMAFQNCRNLESITIGESVKTIHNRAFLNCWNLKNVTVLNPNPPVFKGDDINGVVNVFDNAVYTSSTLYVPKKSVEVYKNAEVWKNWEKIETIPYDFEEDGIYYNITSESEVEVTNESLEGTGIVGDITIPSTVTYSSKTYTVSSIGESAFANSDGITTVDIPASVKNIGTLAFSNCSALTTVKVAYTEEGPAKVIAENEEVNAGTSIGESAFRGCPVLSTIYLGSPVASIGNSAFAACPKIESITVLATEPPTAQDDSFDSEIYSTSTLYVPVVAYDLYKTAPVWSNWATVNSIGGSGIADSFVESDVKVEATDGAITVSGAEGGVCRIFDLRGMEVANRSAISSNESFTVKNSELYIVQLTTKDGKNVSRKVMVK